MPEFFEFDNITIQNIIVICGPAALLLVIILGFRIAFALGKIRREARSGAAVAARIQGEYDRLLAREEEGRQRLNERFNALETELRERVQSAEKVANTTRERLVQLETYLKEFFEVELKSVFDSFDRTVTSILGEMKSELLRGVDRVEEIQAVVDSKTFAQERILDGEGSIYRMITGAETPANDETASSAEQADADISLEDEKIDD